jgi:hypothetical protein
MDTEVFLGTELKLNVNIEPIGDVTMDNYEFEIEVYCSPKKSIVIKKGDAIRIDESNYVILIDSEVVGAGDLKCKITAHIPDGDFEDNIRTEVIGIDTGINIVKAI